MFKMSSSIKKITLAVLVMAIVMAVFPITGASAAGLNNQANAQGNYPRLEKIWAREQYVYKREGINLENASAFIVKVQTRIDAAKGKGWDVSAVQVALNALSAVIPAVQAAHAPGDAIIASHAGFDANGKVTDQATAKTTVKSLAKVLKDTRTAMNGTGKALRNAIKALREAHPRPTTKTGG